MMKPSRVRVRVAALLSLGLAALFPLTATTDPSTHGQVSIEGIYALIEAHIGDEVMRPPRADGRFLLLNGVVITLFHYGINEDKQTTSASYGHYVQDASHFAYRYDDPSVFTEAPSSVTASHKAPWEGMRDFSIIREPGTIRLLSPNGAQELRFDAAGLSYFEGGKVQRVWRRVTQGS
jgi:hypothetical protein